MHKNNFEGANNCDWQTTKTNYKTIQVLHSKMTDLMRTDRTEKK